MLLVVLLVVCVVAFPDGVPRKATTAISSGGTPLIDGSDPTLHDDKPDCGGQKVDERTWMKEREKWSDAHFRGELHFNSRDPQFENLTRPNGGGASFASKCEFCITEDSLPRGERGCFGRQGGENTTFFTTWLPLATHFTIRELRSLESVLYHHPQAKIKILSNTLPTDAFTTTAFLQNVTNPATQLHQLQQQQPPQNIRSFSDLGCSVEIVRIPLKEWAQNTPLEAWGQSLETWKQNPQYFDHVSEVLKLLALNKFGGVAFDLGTVFLNRVSFLKNSVGLRSPQGRLSTNVMAFSEQSPVVLQAMKAFETFDIASPLSFSANALTQVWQRSFPSPSSQLTVLSANAFCPISQENIGDEFVGARKEAVVIKNKELRSNAYAVNLWPLQTRKLDLTEGSLVHYLLEEFCVLCV